MITLMSKDAFQKNANYQVLEFILKNDCQIDNRKMNEVH